MTHTVSTERDPTPAMRARDIDFGLDGGVPRHFCPSQPEFSHATNAFMAALPHLEPYFIHNIREAGEAAQKTGALQAEIAVFVAQEARHAQQHRALNAALASHYPGLPALERAIKERLDRSRKRHSLGFRMAYTAGYEAITYQLICFMMEQRDVWLRDADPAVLALLCWHGAEEVEHKSVAYDAFEAAHGGYFMRAIGLLTALVMTVKDLHGMVRYMLEVDSLWNDRACQARLRRVRLAFLRGFVPKLLGYFRPSYHPSRCADPQPMLHWLERYAKGQDLTRLSAEALDAL
ncbi:MAG TPA: metal-dependent hydrolase [Polyangiales bacterium]|nr:metal-dependent hydrolase [Polyangiales bacterium]